jgi:hypothetical protein
MKFFLYTIGVIILLIIGILFYKWFVNQPCAEWEKPNNVPLSAVWIGGCDGGNGIELVSMKNDTCRFRIYRDWSGDLILDADFVYENCNNSQPTKTNWREYIAYFDGDALGIHSKFQSDSSYCQLVPVFPAYYEEKIE